MRRIKQAEIPTVKKAILDKQKGKCAICEKDLTEEPLRNVCLDHDHIRGHIRMVLCRNCNGIEGKIFNLARRGKRGNTESWFLGKLGRYWKVTEVDIWGLTHPTHKTEDEKRLLRNKKARERAQMKRKAK